MANFTIRPELRDYTDKNGENQVLLVVSYQSRKYRKPLSFKVRPEQFKAGEVIKHPRAKQLNATIQNEISGIELDLINAKNKGLISPDYIKSLIYDKKTDGTLYPFIESQIERLRGTMSNETVRVWESKLKKMKKWHPAPVHFEDIDHKFLSGWANYMRKQHNSENTVYDGEKFLRAMLQRAIPEYLKKNPYEGFERAKYNREVPRYLSDEEIERLRALVDALRDHELKRPGIYFLADMELGLRISDLQKLDPKKDFKNGRFVKKTKKGKTIVSIKVSDRLQGYLEYIKKHPFDMTPALNDKRLKILGQMAGLETRLSSHVARHTLGRRLAKAGVNIRVAQLILGHKNVNTTQIYYHIENTDIDDAIDLISR